MVAYSFKAMFADPIRAGTKRQTIRADRKRHARVDEELQLYTGMRTKQCILLGRAICIGISPITLLFNDNDTEAEGVILPGLGYPDGLEGFARADGFRSWAELKRFWRQNHPGIDEFSGKLVQWGDLLP